MRVEAILSNLKAPVVTQLLYALPTLHDGIHARTSLTVQKFVQLSTVTPTMADCVVVQLETDLTSALSMGVQRMQQNTNWRQWQWQSEDAVFRSASSFR